MRQLLLSFFCCAIISATLAQNPLPETNAESAFEDALDLFQQNQFLASRSTFERYLTNYPEHYRNAEAEYYIAFNAISAGQQDAEFLMNRFVTENPSHPKAISAYFDLGNHYFNQGSYNNALNYYEQIDFDALALKPSVEGRFKLAYCYYTGKKELEALLLFQEVTAFRNDYYEDAQYYSGVISYNQSNYNEALGKLLEAEKDDKFKDLTPELIAGAYLSLKRYDDLIRYTDGLGQRKLQRDIQLLTAEAYFHKEDYSKASELYQLALSSGKGKAAPILYYHQGFANFKSGQENKAIEAFKIAALASDTIGQYGSYYLGILYTKADNKQFAINAFEKASKPDFSLTIKEESSFRVGQLTYELGQFSICIDQLSEFLNEYTTSTFRSSANDLLSDAYLKTSNYDLAINHIEGLRSRSESINRVYQQVTLMKGTRLFNDNKFSRAITLFDKSLSAPNDAEKVVEAYYWKGEAYSIGRKWVDAINAYSRVVFNRNYTSSSFYVKSRYGLAYAYYNTKVYDRAKIQFSEYAKALNGAYDQPRYLDALVRLADCYFVEKNYSAAITNYENALRGQSKDKAYIYLQLGLNHGFNGNSQQGRRNFQQVISNYKNTVEAERSAYQLAQLDFENGQFENAVDEFTLLINDYPKSKLVPDALVKRGVGHYNLQSYDQSIADYQRVLDDFMTHRVANSALLGLQEVASASGSDVNVDNYIERYRQANPNDASLENIEFEAAKSRYFSQDYDEAIAKLNSFNSVYPQSSYKGEALYFLADAHNRSNNKPEALNYFKEALNYPQTSYYNRSVQRIANLEFESGNFSEAIKHFKLLGQVAKSKRESYNALEGLMLSYDKLEITDSTQWYANEILSEAQVSSNGLSSANLYLGKAAIAKNDYPQAINFLRETIGIADDENAAEATYLTGFIYSEQGKYAESNELLFEMNRKFSAYELWLGRSFLLIADNYLAMDELFQAEATLNSIIEKSPINEIVDSAKSKLLIIKAREKEIIEEQRSLSTDTVTTKNEDN